MGTNVQSERACKRASDEHKEKQTRTMIYAPCSRAAADVVHELEKAVKIFVLCIDDVIHMKSDDRFTLHLR